MVKMCNDGLYAENTRVTNFTVANLHVVYDLDGAEPVQLQFLLHSMGIHRNCALDLRCGDPFLAQIRKAHPLARILDNDSKSAVERHLVDAVEEAIRGGDTHRRYVTQLGLQRLADGNYVYVAGDSVLGLPDDVELIISPEIAKYQLARDSQMAEAVAAQQMCQILERNPHVMLPVWGYTIVGALRSVLGGLGLSVFPCLYISGPQDSGKTTLIQQFCLLFDQITRSEAKPAYLRDAGSTEASLKHAVTGAKDVVVLIDDLALSTTTAVTRDRTEKISQLLRFAANESDASKMASSKTAILRICESGVAFTGEIPLTAASEITRVIEIKLDAPMRDGFPEDRAVAATTFYYFMQWLVPQLPAVLEEIKWTYAALPAVEHARLQNSTFLISIGIQLFYRYCRERGFISDCYAAEAIENLQCVLDQWQNCQIQRINQLQQPTIGGNVSWTIRSGYKALNPIHESNVGQDAPLCFKTDASICFRTEALLSWLQSQGLHITTKKELTKILVDEGLVSRERGERRSAAKRLAIRSKKGKVKRRVRYLEFNFKSLKACAILY